LGVRAEFRLTGLVEADETYVGGRGQRGGGGRALVPGRSAIAAVVEDCGERADAQRMAVDPSASQGELGAFVRGAIDQAKAVVVSDDGRAMAISRSTARVTARSFRAIRRTRRRSCPGRTSCSRTSRAGCAARFTG
jgi:hypothetical protein